MSVNRGFCARPMRSDADRPFARLTIRKMALGAVLALLAAPALCPAPALAAGMIWHVRPDGDDSFCDGLFDAADPGTGSLPRHCAFETPQWAVDMALGGETVVLHAGVYDQAGGVVQGVEAIVVFDRRPDLTSEGTRLILKSAGDGPVVFDGGGVTDAGIAIWGTSYLTVEGIELRRFTATGSASFVYGAVVIVGSPDSQWPSGGIVLKSLTVLDTDPVIASGDVAEIAFWCEECYQNTIDSCTIRSAASHGIALGHDGPFPISQNGALVNNTILHEADSQEWRGVLASRTNGWYAQGNYIAETAAPHHLTEGLRIVDSSGWTVTDNVFDSLPAAGLRTRDTSDDGDNSEGHFVVNNTFDCGGAGGDGVVAEGCTMCGIENSILVSCDAGVALKGDCSGTVAGFNDFYQNATNYDAAAASGFTLLGQDVLADPRFEGRLPKPDPYYRLDPLSPAINAADDAHCSVVPDDGRCDIGAFQGPATTGNRPPDRPAVTSVDELTGKSARLHGSRFSDPDAGDRHAASQWQVDLVAEDFSSPVVDSGRTTSDLDSYKAGGLAAETAYKSRVRHQDESGAWSAWSHPASDPGALFTTLVATAIPPKVVVADPAPDASGVPAGVTARLTFNVPLLPSSVTVQTILLTRDGVPVTQAAGSPALDPAGVTVTITPSGLLAPLNKYKIVVQGGSSGILSRDGSIPGKDFSSKFTVETALASSSPSHDATGVPVDVAPALTFKWPVDPATVTAATFTLKDSTSGKQVPLASVTPSPDGLTVTLVPAGVLAGHHKHAVTVASDAGGLRFADGRTMAKKLKISFKTQ